MRFEDGIRRRATAALLALTAALGGCHSWTAPRMPWRARPTKVEGVVAPADRLSQLRQWQDKASSLPELEQIQRSTSLAQSIQNENDPLIRAQILRTLAAFPTPAATAVLTAATQDGNRDVRVACCEAWAMRGGPEAVTILTGLTKDDDVDVRLASLRALGELGDAAAVPALAPMLDDRDPAVQYRTVQTLRQITGRDFGDDMSAWREFVNGGNPREESFASRLLRWF